MLTYLAIKNIAVIERAGLEFGKGLNVITGETGAGKSVLVGALKYLTGDRQGKVASGNAGSKFSAEAIFSDIPCMDKDIVSQYEIEDELIVFRETDENGKNKAFLNGRAAPVNRLKDISEYLIDIHGQHENQFLFNPSKHLSFIDCFVDDNVKNAFEASYRQYRQKYEELERIKNNLEESERLKSIYKFQFDEIDSMNIDVEMDAVIEDKIKFLSNMEKVREAVAAASEAIADGEISASDLIEKAAKAVSVISGVSESAAKASECLASAAANLSDALSYIASIAETGENFSEDELNRLIDRKYKLIDIMKKYGGSLEAALLHKERLAADLDVLNNGSDTVSKLQHETEELLGIAGKKAGELNDARRKAADFIISGTETILKELELVSSKFEVIFTEKDTLDACGGISAEFFISTNAGFKPAPLSAVASGGEVSRVMLALKEVFADFDSIDVMLFDEIDTGISGKAAGAVAKKLKKLSEKKQIIVITHLPVVAAMGDSHFHISKSEKNGVSSTDITKLDTKGKVEVIATMIAGEVTAASLAQAEDLIKRSAR